MRILISVSLSHEDDAAKDLDADARLAARLSTKKYTLEEVYKMIRTAKFARLMREGNGSHDSLMPVLARLLSRVNEEQE